MAAEYPAHRLTGLFYIGCSLWIEDVYYALGLCAGTSIVVATSSEPKQGRGVNRLVISDSHKFLFVHIPKTAGQSVSAALAPEGDRRHLLCRKGKHETVESFVQRNGRAAFECYYSFCVVRHPLDRLLSHYFYLKANPYDFPEISGVESVEAYVEAIERGDQTIIRKRERVLPQHYYVKLESLPVAVNEVIRFEDLQSSFSNLCHRLGLSDRALPILNSSKRVVQPISARAKAFIEQYYEADFRLFGY